MSKLTCALLIVALVYCVGVYADNDDSLLDNGFPMLDLENIKFPSEEDIAKLAPTKDSKVSGTYTQSHSSMEMVNGKVVKNEAGGKELQNDNGIVTKSTYNN